MLVHGELRQRAVGEGRGDNLWLHVAELQLGAIDEQQHSAAEGIQTSLITSTLLVLVHNTLLCEEALCTGHVWVGVCVVCWLPRTAAGAGGGVAAVAEAIVVSQPC